MNYFRLNRPETPKDPTPVPDRKKNPGSPDTNSGGHGPDTQNP